MTTFTDTVSFKSTICCACHMPFAMERGYYDKRLKDHKGFYCPAGHPQHFTGQSEEDKLRDELERQRQKLEAEQAHGRRIARERDQVAKSHHRMRERVFNGVCPCCNRTFQNLLRHMRTEHEGELNLRTVRTAFGLTQEQLAEEAGVTPVQVSKYERNARVSGYATSALERWMERHAKDAA